MKKIELHFSDIIAAFLSLFLAWIFGFNSPLHPWIGSETGTDSSVFKTVAMMMEHGYMPYRDSFDHKGPIIYLLNYLGNRISQYRGIWIIELITIAATIFIMYKISRFFCGYLASVITVLTALSLLFFYFECGNFTEEYAMPCIAYALFVFLDYFINNRVSNIRLLVSGAGAGIVLLLRPNMVSVWMVFCVTIICVLVVSRKLKELLLYIALFTVGVVLIMAPVLIWLAINNDFSYFIQDYLVFNSQYTSSDGGATFHEKWRSFFSFFRTSVYMLAFFSMAFHLKERKLLNISYLIYLVLTLILMAMGGNQFGHYGMILVPAVVYPISLIFRDIEKIEVAQISKALLLVVSLFLLITVIVSDWIDILEIVSIKYAKRNISQRDPTIENIVTIVDNNTNESDKISVYGNMDIFYVLSDREHATRYSYQIPIVRVNPAIKNEYFTSLKEEHPPVIVVQSGCYDNDIKSFLEENEYLLYYANDENNLEHSFLIFMR